MCMLQNITVIGSGSWATALVKIFTESGLAVNWLLRSREQAEHIRVHGKNCRYLCNAELDARFIYPTTDVTEALTGSQLVVFAVPSAYLEATLENIDKDLLAGKQLVVSIKGFVAGTGYIPSVFIRHYLNRDEPVMVISGPCHAEEIAMRKNTYMTVAGEDESCVKALADCLNLPYVKTIISHDAAGIEFVAILKNIIAIATGVAQGLNYGDNFQAVLTSNAMREVSTFLQEVYPGKRDLYDSVYFGDLLVTAYSDYSRNRTFGKLIGRGMRVQQSIQAMGMVAEGYNASRELDPLLKKMGLAPPIINSTFRILHQHANPYHEFKLVEKYLR